MPASHLIRNPTFSDMSCTWRLLCEHPQLIGEITHITVQARKHFINAFLDSYRDVFWSMSYH